jgi:hypothetical protein
MKIYSLMPFDVFNGSLVEHCLVYVAGLELVTYSNIQGTRREKSPNKCALEVTGLTGDRHQSDRCRPSEAIGQVTRHLCPVLTQNVHLAPNTQQAEQAGFTRAKNHKTC